MPELPDILLYLSALERRSSVVLDECAFASPFLLRSVDPPVYAIEGQVIRRLERIGKRIVWSFDDEVYPVIHLMMRAVPVEGARHGDSRPRGGRGFSISRLGHCC